MIFFILIISEISINFIDEKTVGINSTMEKKNYKFNFDRAFDCDTTQIQIFEYLAQPILDSKILLI